MADPVIVAVIAERLGNGTARSFPSEPPRDRKGLRIAIWAWSERL